MAKTTAHKPGNSRKPAPPLTAHRLFPPLLALWFSALFSLGSLAMRPAVLEAVVLALRIDQVLPFAAPPLGMTARVLLAVAMAALGAILGLLLARRLARTGSMPIPAGTTVPADPEAPAPVRRRKLSTEAKQVPPDYAFSSAPLPGGVPPILDVRECEFVDHSPTLEQRTDTRRETFAPPPLAADLSLAALPVEQAEPAPLAPFVDPTEPAAHLPEPQSGPLPVSQDFAPPAPLVEPMDFAAPATELEGVAMPAASPDLAPMPFAPPPEPAQVFEPALAEEEPAPPALAAPEIAEHRVEFRVEPPAEAPVAPPADLTTASNLALVNRLALSLQARQARIAAAVLPAHQDRAAFMPPAPPCAATFSAAADPAPEPALPEALPRLFGAPAAAPAPLPADAALRRFQPEPAMTAAPFPRQDRAETEEALRSAISTLQRLSGAA